MACVMEPDSTVQAFAGYLTEMRGRNTITVQQLLSEMSIIRDSISSNNSELTEFKRHSTTIAQQMQSQLTDLREKLTNAFGEITTLVQQKTHSDQDMMKDIGSLQQNLSSKATEVEALKRSYASTHQQLQSNLIQIQNNLSVTGSELESAKTHADQAQKDFGQKSHDLEKSLRRVEDQLAIATNETKSDIQQVHCEIQRIQTTLNAVATEFGEHKRHASSSGARLQQQLQQIDEHRRRQSQHPQQHQLNATVSGTHSVRSISASQNPHTPTMPNGNQQEMIHNNSRRSAPGAQGSSPLGSAAFLTKRPSFNIQPVSTNMLGQRVGSTFSGISQQ